jgi:hypothetical protein
MIGAVQVIKFSSNWLRACRANPYSDDAHASKSPRSSQFRANLERPLIRSAQFARANRLAFIKELYKFAGERR